MEEIKIQCYSEPRFDEDGNNIKDELMQIYVGRDVIDECYWSDGVGFEGLIERNGYTIIRECENGYVCIKSEK